ncbi:MAG: PTS system mannose/fructose/sorbose family transporter subunit IID [Betaproteobacteria bacterium]
MNGDRNMIGTIDLLMVFWRAFFLQASWSFDRMQTVGFAYAIEPVLKKLYTDPIEYNDRLRLHLEYFNTQPYFASFILGAAVRLEQDRATGRNTTADVSGLKATLMAPLGALGDSFFWGSLKPMAAVAAVAVLMTGSWWAPILFLMLYNAWHVGLRLGMLFWGFASGGDVAALMTRYRFTIMAKRFKIVSLSLLGAILGMMPSWRPEFRPVFNAGLVPALLGLGLTIVLLEFMRRGGSPVKLMLGLAVICLVLAYAGVV